MTSVCLEVVVRLQCSSLKDPEPQRMRLMEKHPLQDWVARMKRLRAAHGLRGQGHWGKKRTGRRVSGRDVYRMKSCRLREMVRLQYVHSLASRVRHSPFCAHQKACKCRTRVFRGLECFACSKLRESVVLHQSKHLVLYPCLLPRSYPRYGLHSVRVSYM